MARGVSTTLPTKLPARYSRGAAWQLDRRCKAVREVAAGLVALWQDLGGFEGLSAQQRILCERTAFIHHRVLAFESAVLSGKEPPFDAGVYSNLANVLMGHLKTLGLKRQARAVDGLQAYLSRRCTAMIDALIAGRLYGIPQSRTSKSGNAFATAKVRTPMANGESSFVNVIAFSDTAKRALLALADGDAVALAGELKVSIYTDKDGVAKPSLDLVAHAVLTEYHVARKRKTMNRPEESERFEAPSEQSW